MIARLVSLLVAITLGAALPAQRADAASEWLAKEQKADGRWSDRPDQDGEPHVGTTSAASDLRATALGILAILGEGARQGDPHRRNLVSAVAWLRAQQDAAGRFGAGEAEGWILDHALATYALCEFGLQATEPEGSQGAVAAFDVLTRHLAGLQDGRDAELLAWCSLCCDSARRFEAHLKELAEEHEGWQRLLDSQPRWAAGAPPLAAQVERLRASMGEGGPRARAAALVVDALWFAERVVAVGEKLPQGALPEAPRRLVECRGADTFDSDPLAMVLFGRAAGVHLRSSSTGFEEAWLELDARVRPALLASQHREGDLAGSWAPGAAPGDLGGGICATATRQLLLRILDGCRPLAPRRWNRTLHAAIGLADRLRVLSRIDGAATQQRILLDLRDAEGVAKFAAGLVIDGEHSGFSCMCLGEEVLEFHRGEQLLARLVVHHGRSLRWCDGNWVGDGWLTTAGVEHLIQWLAERGIPGPMWAVHAERRAEAKAKVDVARWQEAMPNSLRTFWRSPDLVHRSARERDAMRQALRAEFPRTRDRILALLDWYGSGSGFWGSHPSYESEAEDLLFECETREVLAAIEGVEWTPRRLEGAARFFGAWRFGSEREKDLADLPVGLARTLLKHSLDTALDEDKRARARGAFGRRAQQDDKRD